MRPGPRHSAPTKHSPTPERVVDKPPERCILFQARDRPYYFLRVRSMPGGTVAGAAPDLIGIDYEFVFCSASKPLLQLMTALSPSQGTVPETAWI